MRTSIALIALCLTGPASAQQYVRPGGTPVYQPLLVRPQQPQPVAAQDGPAAFLHLLNAERARSGRGPVAWDATLAAYASTNGGTHQPGSSGGASQCWAASRSYVVAFHQWMASPAHRAILIGARSSVGVSLCPSGITANAR